MSGRACCEAAYPSGIITLTLRCKSIVAMKPSQDGPPVKSWVNSITPLQVLGNLLVALGLVSLVAVGFAQSGKGTGAGRRSVTLNVIAHAPVGKQVTKEDFDLYDSGTAQEIESFSHLDVGSRVVLLVDSSANLKAE